MNPVRLSSVSRVELGVCRGSSIRFPLRWFLGVCCEPAGGRAIWNLTSAGLGPLLWRLNRIRRISVLLWLAVWLAATQHCVLEAAGVWEGGHDEEASTCCPDTPSNCEHDGCEVVESGSVVASTSAAKVSAPEWQALWLVLMAERVEPQALSGRLAVRPAERTRSLEWVPIRHVVRRAAPVPRAPSVSVA